MLAGRDLLNGAERFGLGYVADPAGPEHERFIGRLAIPYLRHAPVTGWSVVGIRFRAVDDRLPKYTSEENVPITLYNTRVLLEDHNVMAICEGELDALSASLAGIPAVGVPGTQGWKSEFVSLFAGYDRVVILADNDKPQYKDPCQRCGVEQQCRGHNPGIDFAKKVAADLPNAAIISWNVGEDTNSTMVQHGRNYIRERVFPPDAREKQSEGAI